MPQVEETSAQRAVAVITPYYKEHVDVLWAAHESVVAQGDDVDHFMIADGHPNIAVEQWNVKHTILPNANNDNGNTPRYIGSILAKAAGYEFIAYLDADNWYLPGHIASLKQLHQKTNAHVTASLRSFYALNGSVLENVSESDENQHQHIDTSCYLIHRNGFSCLAAWVDMPPQLSPICDRVFLAGIRQKNLQIAYSDHRTVAFRTQYAIHYQSAGIPPPPEAKYDVGSEPAKWLLTLEGVRETTRRLGFFPF